MPKYIDIYTLSRSTIPNVLEVRCREYGESIPADAEFFSAGLSLEKSPPKYDDSLLEEVYKCRDERGFAAVVCGLDRQNGPALRVQKQYFEPLAVFSDIVRKPLIIHCTKAFAELQDIFAEIDPGNPWIIQGFDKNRSLAKRLLAGGMYLSFGSDIIENTNTSEALLSTPFNRLFLESGSQDRYTIEDVYIAAAELKGVSVERLKQITARNFEAVFGISEKSRVFDSSGDER